MYSESQTYLTSKFVNLT